MPDSSAHTTINNTFINCHCAVFIGGGRRHVVEGNNFQRCGTAVHMDNRGMGWDSKSCAPGGRLEQGEPLSCRVNWFTRPRTNSVCLLKIMEQSL